MANWIAAYNWMMDFEDAPRACKQVPDACPSGVTGPCSAISGINSAVWPAEFAAILALSHADREASVQQFYQDHFWNKWLAALDSDELCKRVLDFAVNGGSGASVRCLQEAVNAISGTAPIAEDGSWGPATVGAANVADPIALVASFKARRVAYYQTILNQNPAKTEYLTAWKARAEK